MDGGRERVDGGAWNGPQGLTAWQSVAAVARAVAGGRTSEE